jgi:hypothetical protein
MNIDIRGTEKWEEGTRDEILDSIQTMVEIKKKRDMREKRQEFTDEDQEKKVVKRGTKDEGLHTKDVRRESLDEGLEKGHPTPQILLRMLVHYNFGIGEDRSEKNVQHCFRIFLALGGIF